MRSPSNPEAFNHGRRYPQVTPLGRLMAHLTMSKQEMVNLSGIHERTLTEYLSGRVAIRPHHLRTLGEVLEIDPNHLIPKETT